MKAKIPLIARILLGLIFFVFGLLGLLNVFPPPPDMPANVKTFMDGIMITGYFFPFLKLTETICGFLLISGFAAPLALIVLAPVTIHIFLFHTFMTPGLKELILPLIMVLLHILAARGYWRLYRPLFTKGQ
jgi:putative oxidoreductase